MFCIIAYESNMIFLKKYKQINKQMEAQISVSSNLCEEEKITTFFF